MADLSSPSSSVDLSRLPAPTVVEQLDYETVYAELLAYVQSPGVLPSFDATVDSDPAVKILQVFAWRELIIRQRFNDRARQTMVAYATGSNLDQLGALFGVTRLVVDAGDPTNGFPVVMESDDDLRERIVLSPESQSVAGPESAYIFHARSVDGTIRDASASSPAPGEVVVSILSRNGDGTASPEQIAAVGAKLATIETNKLRPLTDFVTVASAEIVTYYIDADLTLLAGPDQTVVLAAAQASIAAWVDAGGKLGVDAVRAAITAALMVAGVQNLRLNQPPADVVVDKTQTAHCAGIAVRVSGVGA
ncbi:baseplate assembly protein [Sphingomonas panacis]|uniref:Baseplate assembly protein n=1 Tax=Sphingomonas panacis TaxID=1560345 RepID=A0A1B3ZGK5_9SPHN|nr:baseplate J/gp47 family protein [Sphingomonas panacis]AOH86568.1 baseplate assembly protein [Sphingomonas panacis]